MDINIELKFTEEYYKEAYQEMVKNRLKFRKWQPLLIVFHFLSSVLFLWYILKNLDLKTYIIIPLIFFFFGLYEFYDYYKIKRNWLKARREEGITDESVTLRFKGDEIEHSGPYAKGVIKWNGFKCIQVTDNGLFLIPQKGISIYLPKYCFSNEDEMKSILNKFKSIEGIKVI